MIQQHVFNVINNLAGVFILVATVLLNKNVVIKLPSHCSSNTLNSSRSTVNCKLFLFVLCCLTPNFKIVGFCLILIQSLKRCCLTLSTSTGPSLPIFSEQASATLSSSAWPEARARRGNWAAQPLSMEVRFQDIKTTTTSKSTVTRITYLLQISGKSLSHFESIASFWAG